MKVTEYSERVEQFEREYGELPIMSNENVIIYVIETIGGPLRTAIDVGEETTSQDLRKAITLALKCRDNLLKFQGRTGLGSDYLLLAEIEKDVRVRRFFRNKPVQDYTYNDVAQAINSVIIDWLCKYVGKRLNSVQPKYRKTLDLHIWGIEERIPDELERCKRLLLMLHFSEDQVEEILSECVTSIENDDELPNDYPVNFRKLRETLQWFRGKK